MVKYKINSVYYTSGIYTHIGECEPHRNKLYIRTIIGIHIRTVWKSIFDRFVKTKGIGKTLKKILLYKNYLYTYILFFHIHITI